MPKCAYVQIARTKNRKFVYVANAYGNCRNVRNYVNINFPRICKSYRQQASLAIGDT